MSDWPQGPPHFGFVTALPASPPDGSLCVYTDSLTTPNYWWQLRYNNGEATYKWEYIGGVPWRNITAAFTTARVITATAAGTGVPTDPMTVTLPLAGDWDVVISSDLRAQWNNSVIHSYAVGGTAASQDWGHWMAHPSITSPSGDNTHFGATSYRHTGLAASTNLAEQAWVGASASQTVGKRTIQVTPVRVV